MLYASLLLLGVFVLAEENNRYVLEEIANGCQEDFVPLSEPHCKSVAAKFGIILGVASGAEVDAESDQCTGYTQKGRVNYREIQYLICANSTFPDYRPVGNVKVGHLGVDACKDGFKNITNIELCRKAVDRLNLDLNLNYTFNESFGLKSGELNCNIRFAYKEDIIARFSSDHEDSARWVCEDSGTTADENPRYVLEEMASECREGYVPLTDPHCESAAATFGIILGVARGAEVDAESNQCTGYTQKGKVDYREIQYWICEDSTVPERRPLGHIERGVEGEDECPEGYNKITNIEVCRKAAVEAVEEDYTFNATFGLKSGTPICNIRLAYADEIMVRFSSDHGRHAQWICEEDPGTVDL